MKYKRNTNVTISKEAIELRKLTALGMITLTLTSMIPLTANAAVARPYSQCNNGRNVVTVSKNCNVDDLKSRLQQLGVDGNNIDWSKLINNGNTGKNCNNGNTGNTGNNGNTGNTGNTGNNGNSGNTGNDGNTGNTDNNGNTGTTPDDSTGNSTNKSYTQQVVDLVNAERAKEGLAPLTIDPNVEKAATVRANEIQSNFDHTRPNGSSFSTALKEQGVNYRGAGENIAWGQKTPQDVVNAWMNSAGHRANIMNKSYTHIGVGNTQNNSGTQYWVQLFTY